jgi:hypothetical protein
MLILQKKKNLLLIAQLRIQMREHIFIHGPHRTMNKYVQMERKELEIHFVTNNRFRISFDHYRQQINSYVYMPFLLMHKQHRAADVTSKSLQSEENCMHGSYLTRRGQLIIQPFRNWTRTASLRTDFPDKINVAETPHPARSKSDLIVTCHCSLPEM